MYRKNAEFFQENGYPYPRICAASIAMAAEVFQEVVEKKTTGADDEVFLGEDKEWLIQYCKEELERKHTDYFIFGHRHLPIQHPLGNNSEYINLGEWINYNTYLEVSETSVELKTWD